MHSNSVHLCIQSFRFVNNDKWLGVGCGLFTCQHHTSPGVENGKCELLGIGTMIFCVTIRYYTNAYRLIYSFLSAAFILASILLECSGSIVEHSRSFFDCSWSFASCSVWLLECSITFSVTF
ncbi:hypothetical protein RF11_01607 [Thelohanellus kitauei]|uniref:Uncharacterized protein n=1 Tax=Thelohanellus kitauei TaxID=669202 RepID=A0A0C2IXR3_THEKT|nr:hypothetical protein RF11_01607 [Thelohanellus kitauei]